MSFSGGGRVLYVRREPPGERGLAEVLEMSGYAVLHHHEVVPARANIYNDPPDLILLSSRIAGWRDFVLSMKSDSVFCHLPIIVLIEGNVAETMKSLRGLPLDDFVDDPLKVDELLLRLRIRYFYSVHDLDANPLTRLPGNTTIFSVVQSMIDGNKPFALCYADLDNFKAYNDRYGFARGDEALRMTARILTNAVKKTGQPENFLGHIGGDDFVFVIPPERIDEKCREVISHFDLVGQTLFDDEDRVRGYFESVDRQGRPQRFPLLSISIAVIDSTVTHLSHHGEAAAAAGELKKKVKTLEGSNYMVDRRTRRTKPSVGAAPRLDERVKDSVL